MLAAKFLPTPYWHLVQGRHLSEGKVHICTSGHRGGPLDYSQAKTAHFSAAKRMVVRHRHSHGLAGQQGPLFKRKLEL
jgi:hypothetical protein